MPSRGIFVWRSCYDTAALWTRHCAVSLWTVFAINSKISSWKCLLRHILSVIVLRFCMQFVHKLDPDWFLIIKMFHFFVFTNSFHKCISLLSSCLSGWCRSNFITDIFHIFIFGRELTIDYISNYFRVNNLEFTCQSS